MADSVATMLTVVRDHLDETSAGYWSDAEITRAVVRNFRQLWARIIAIRDDWFKSTTPATLSILADGTLKYALPADFFRAASIRTTTSGKEFIRWEWRSCKDPIFIAGQRGDITNTDPSVIYYDIEGVSSIVISPVPRQALAAALEYYTIPTDPATAFTLPDPCLRYVEYGAVAELLAKGPVGAYEYWEGKRKEEWAILLPLLGAPRSGQNTDHAMSPFGE